MNELDAIPTSLHPAYQVCKKLNAAHGKTYFLATRLLPADKRPAVHALYGFARMVDDVVDVETMGSVPKTPEAAAADLDALEKRLHSALQGEATGDEDSDLVLAALADTARRYTIPTDYFTAFLHSMRMDIPGTVMFRSHYESMDQLREYMYGSAAVIGLQMLPILGTAGSAEEARGPAAALGEAFQLTNFIRDMGEDLERGRIYLPTDELTTFGVDEELLVHCQSTDTVDVRLERALAHFIAVTRAVYRTADPGIDMLDPRVRGSMRTAFQLYGGILDEVEAGGFQVLNTRASVPTRKKLRVAIPQLASTAAPRLRTTLSDGTRFRKPSPARAE